MCDASKPNGTKNEDLQYLVSIIKVRVGFRQEKPELPLGVSQSKSKKKDTDLKLRFLRFRKKIDTELDLRFLSLGQKNRYGLHPYLHPPP